MLVCAKRPAKSRNRACKTLFKRSAVYIATPVGAYFEQATMALERGVNVFMEKPISLNYAEATLSQEETGKLKYIYSPQGAYEAQQNRVVTKAKNYYGKRGNIYGKQFKAFNALVAKGKTDYANAEQALHIQKLCDGIYKNS